MSEKRWREKKTKAKKCRFRTMLAQNHGDEKVRHLDSLSLWSKHWLNSVTAAEKKRTLSAFRWFTINLAFTMLIVFPLGWIFPRKTKVEFRHWGRSFACQNRKSPAEGGGKDGGKGIVIEMEVKREWKDGHSIGGGHPDVVSKSVPSVIRVFSYHQFQIIILPAWSLNNKTCLLTNTTKCFSLPSHRTEIRVSESFGIPAVVLFTLESI